MITIEKVISWTIPLFGNKRIFAYGKLLVSDGKTKRLVTTKEDSSGSYITFNRKRYRIRNSRYGNYRRDEYRSTCDNR